MHHIGRYERLREMDLGTGALGPPLLFDRREFDRKRDPLSPYPHSPEWWKSPSGAWVNVQRKLTEQRGSLSVGQALQVGVNGIFGQYESPVSSITVDLNTAYTAGSAGKAIGARFAIPVADTLNAVYFYVHAFTGTRANVNDVELRVYADSSDAPNTGAALASASVDPSGFASGWFRFAGLSHAWSAATGYWVSISDADGGATDYVTLRLHGGITNDNSRGWNFPTSRSCNTTNGWSTVTLSGGAMYFVLRFASGMSLGYGAAFNGTLTSGTLQRGARLSTGLTAPLKIWGFSGPLNIAGTPTGNIYAGTDGPVTGSVATGSLGISGGLSTNRTGVMLTAPYTLAAATPYRLVLQGSTASTIFRSYKTGTVNAGSASDLMASFPGNGTQTITEEQSGTPNTWGLDDTNAYCPVTVHIYDQVAAGGGLLVPGGMRGGMHG